MQYQEIFFRKIAGNKLNFDEKNLQLSQFKFGLLLRARHA